MAGGNPGQIFQLSPELYGLSSLGQGLGQLAQLKDQRQAQDEERELREQQQKQQTFQNILALGDRESAADYLNTVVSPGANAEARMTTDEWLDRAMIDGLTRRSSGEPLSPFTEDLLNQRLFGTLSPETQKAIEEGRLTNVELSNEALRLSNEGIPLENLGRELDNSLRRLQIDDAERQARINADLDALVQQEFPEFGEYGVAALQFASQRAALENTRVNTLQGRQAIAESQARIRRINAEIEALATQGDGSTAEMATMFAPQIRALVEQTQGNIPARVALEYLMNPANEEIPEEMRTQLDEASGLLREIAITEGRRALEGASDEARQMLTTIAQIPELRQNQDILFPVLTRVMNEAFGEGTATMEEVGSWLPFGIGDSEQLVIDKERLLSIPEGVLLAADEGPSNPTITPEGIASLANEMVGFYNGDTAAALQQARTTLEGTEDPADRATVQALIDHLSGSPATPSGSAPASIARPLEDPFEIDADLDLTPPEPSDDGPIPTTDAGFQTRIKNLSSSQQLMARQLWNRRKEQEARIAELEGRNPGGAGVREFYQRQIADRERIISEINARLERMFSGGTF